MSGSCCFRVWVTVCVLALVPQLALAQEAHKAGVVTALKGQVVVARATLPRPAPLNFKDDVFFQDRVTTERDSTVRLLLGGKALITIRELSDFRIQEEPNKATITLGLGRMALQVMKRLMNPGEEIEVRTPNAIAAIRGSFILWDVTPDRTIVISLTPSTHTAGGITYHIGPNEMWTIIGSSHSSAARRARRSGSSPSGAKSGLPMRTFTPSTRSLLRSTRRRNRSTSR